MDGGVKEGGRGEGGRGGRVIEGTIYNILRWDWKTYYRQSED